MPAGGPPWGPAGPLPPGGAGTTRHQSWKSSDFSPWIGHFLNNGIILLLISESLVTIKSTASSRLRRVTFPQYKNSIKLFSKHSSLACWVIINFNRTLNPVLYFESFLRLTIKHPSADVNPANQFGSIIFVFSTRGLATGTTSVKANFNSSDKPRGGGGLHWSLDCDNFNKPFLS